MTAQIIHGDCRDVLKSIPTESVNCVVTSPPYWAQRDYGCEGQMGQEPTLAAHIEAMVGVFSEVKRTLKKNGVVFLNYGDCYATTPAGWDEGKQNSEGASDCTLRDKPFRSDGFVNPDRPEEGLMKMGELCLIPWRLAIALQNDGWFIRQIIIWNKTNQRPDFRGKYRPGSTFEPVLMLTKSVTHYYDWESVALPSSNALERMLNDEKKLYRDEIAADTGFMPVKGSSKTRGRVADYAKKKARGEVKKYDTDIHMLRNVWTLPASRGVEGHSATFPEGLVEPCILAGCINRGVVLDPFAGTGTVGMVAERLNRNSILIEVNKEWVDHMRKKINGSDFAVSAPAPKPAHHDLFAGVGA